MERLPDFIAQQLVLVLAFAGLTVAIIVTFAARFTRGYRDVTPAQLTALINRENALVIDISPGADFAKAHIPGSRHVAPGQFDPEHKDLGKVKDRPIVVVCRNGMASGAAAKRLLKAGFTRVSVLTGGIAQWQAADLPVARGRT